MSEALASTLLHLVNIESVSGGERALTDWLGHEAAALGMAEAGRGPDWIVFGPPRSGLDLVVLAGHSDTVPAQGNLPGRREDGTVHGLGAADMKASLAVMLELARWMARERPRLAVDVAFVIFGHEELPLAESMLPHILKACPLVLEARLVVMMEPTGNQIHAGCLGNIIGSIDFSGVAAHSARPWLGRNAIHEAVRGLEALVAAGVNEVEVGGLVFREVVNVTTISGGVANNVIPDHVTCGVNYRYASTRTPLEAEARLQELVGADGRLTIVSNAPPAPMVLDNPLLARLRQVGSLAVEPKQAWTPVAEFAQVGLDAVNFGPGDPAFAHRRDEQVAVAAMERSLDILKNWLLGA